MNQSWKKSRNYRKYPASDGSVRHVITINGQSIEVTPEVFSEYARLDRYERYQEEKAAGHLLSIDRIINEDAVMELCPGIVSSSAEEDFIGALNAMERQALLARLPQILSELNEQEQFLITALYLDGRSERDVARALGVSQPAVHKRQVRLLRKLKELFKKF